MIKIIHHPIIANKGVVLACERHLGFPHDHVIFVDVEGDTELPTQTAQETHPIFFIGHRLKDIVF